MCTYFTESVEHLENCCKLAPLKLWLRATTEEYSWSDNEQKQCFMLGLHPHEEHGDGSVSLWLLWWSALIRNLIKMSTEGAILNTEVIMKKALETFTTRASSLLFRAKTLHRRVMSKTGGNPPESYKKLSRLIAPLGAIRPSGQINLTPELFSILVYPLSGDNRGSWLKPPSQKKLKSHQGQDRPARSAFPTSTLLRSWRSKNL